MLQQEQPEDLVIPARMQCTVCQFVQWSAHELGITLRFEGREVIETFITKKIECKKRPAIQVSGTIARIDTSYFRPVEVETPPDAPSKVKQKFAWAPEITVQ